MREWEFALSVVLAHSGGLKPWGYSVHGKLLANCEKSNVRTAAIFCENLVNSSTQSQSALSALEAHARVPDIDFEEGNTISTKTVTCPSTSTPLGSPAQGRLLSLEFSDDVLSDTAISRKRRLFDIDVSPIFLKHTNNTGDGWDSNVKTSFVPGELLGNQAVNNMNSMSPARSSTAATSHFGMMNKVEDTFHYSGDMPATPPPKPMHDQKPPADLRTLLLNVSSISEHKGNFAIATDIADYIQNGKVPGRNDNKTKEFWDSVLARQSDMLRSISTADQSIVARVFENWKILSITYNNFLLRTPEVFEGIEMFASNAVKLYESLILRGCQEVSSLPHEFVSTILSRYLSSPKNMHEHSRSWISRREILLLMCSQLTNLDIHLSLMALLNEIQLKFISKWCTDSNFQSERNNNFVSYCLGEITGLINQCSQRLRQINKRQRYSLHC